MDVHVSFGILKMLKRLWEIILTWWKLPFIVKEIKDKMDSKPTSGIIKCAICGSAIQRIKEYQRPYPDNRIVVDLRCSNEACGQDLTIPKSEIQNLMMNFPYAKKV